MGYHSKAAYPGYLANSLIQKVVFRGTREEVLHHRKRITDRLRILSSGKMSVVFSVLKINQEMT